MHQDPNHPGRLRRAFSSLHADVDANIDLGGFIKYAFGILVIGALLPFAFVAIYSIINATKLFHTGIAVVDSFVASGLTIVVAILLSIGALQFIPGLKKYIGLET